jgi:S1/P1 Nuclease
MKLRVAAALAAGAITLAPRAFAWGPVGHETVAYIAEDHLTPVAKQAVESLLGADLDLADVSNWADQVRLTSRPETAGWHFIDIPDRRGGVVESDEPNFCSQGSHDNCVVNQIGLDEAQLANARATAVQKLEALKFLVHFVGDVHQPLHCADDSDRGGNEKVVRFVKPASRSTTGTKIKLHALWDRLIEIQTKESARELASELEQSITDSELSSWQSGTPADWAWESFEIAHDAIYSEFSAGPTDSSGVALPRDYYSTKMRDIVNTQLERAGIRLAWVLNELFK